MREKELRLALICYGGVSLAIYMHGVTREIWHLVRASRNFHDHLDRTAGSQGIYRDLLQCILDSTGIKMRVITDIISGSSAGGINGIFLSQAIVTGQSLEPLTDLWLDKADVETLIDPDARALSRFSKFWAAPIAWAILRRKGGGIERSVSVEAQDEVATKLSGFVRARWFAPPFGGTVFSTLLLDAFMAMEKSQSGPSLLPENQPLDLFVTVTDFVGHDEILRLNSPPVVTESEHRITISFSTRARGNSQIAAVPELVFAARATASFPGAFPPFSVRELDRLVQVRQMDWPDRDMFLRRILPQQFAAGNAEDTVLIDGSVLANAPFNQAIGALRNRPARREVDRRFVYIDPKPGRSSFRPKLNGNTQAGNPVKPPGWFTTIFGATSNIPREQPIRDSLDKIEGRSQQIERMQQVTEGLRAEIERSLEDMLGKTWFLSQPTPERIRKWRATANQKAAKASGYSYPAYGHLKMAGVVDDMVAVARRACPDETPGFFRALRGAIWNELKRQGLDSIAGLKGLGATDQAIQFFRDHDVRFRIRRLRFLARRLVDEVEDRDDAGEIASAPLHDAIYAMLAQYLERETSDYLGQEFAQAVRNAVEEPSAFIDMLKQKRNLIAQDQQTDEQICAALLALPDEQRRIMLLGFIGYPLFDIATLPLLQGEGLDEFDPVKVDRISPEDARSIRKGGAAETLKGIEFNNFGAFFSRSYRENDYLWGRLHGVDRLIDILLSAVSEHKKLPAGTATVFKKQAFHAILDQEQDRLRKIAPLIASLRIEIDAIV